MHYVCEIPQCTTVLASLPYEYKAQRTLMHQLNCATGEYLNELCTLTQSGTMHFSIYTYTQNPPPQTSRFLRRLKLDLSESDRSVLLGALVGPLDGNGDGGRGGNGGRGVSFESEGGSRRAKRGKEKGGGDDGSGVRVFFRDFLELVLAEKVQPFGFFWHVQTIRYFTRLSLGRRLVKILPVAQQIILP